VKWLREHPWAAAGLASFALWAAVELLRFAAGPSPGQAAFLQFVAALIVLAWACVLGMALLRRLLAFDWAPLAVARTVLDEALRMKIAVVFVALLLLCLAGLPCFLDADQPLRYRIQTFLHWSLAATGFLLSLMTVFLACGTLSLEVQDLRIFTTLTKPIGRGAYLLGKWLGLVFLNAILLGVAGGAIYGFALYLSRLPAKDALDREAVANEVLTARVAVTPHPAYSFDRRAQERLEALKRESHGPLAEDDERLLATLREQVRKQFWSIGPARRETYVFEGLQEAKRRGEAVQLRFKMTVSRYVEGEEIRVGFGLNGRTPVTVLVPLGTYRLYHVPPEEISDSGRLELTVANANPDRPDESYDGTISFSTGNGLQILFRVGGFGPNFARGLLLEWIKLAFLSMLGLAAATYLGFPVACLFTLAALLTAVLSGYLLGSLDSFRADVAASGLPGAATVLTAVLKAVVWLSQHYSRYDAVTDVVNGRWVPWDAVGSCLVWIGFVWSGIAGLGGWLVFRVRELGRVQV
jgi:hypothetical protein